MSKFSSEEYKNLSQIKREIDFDDEYDSVIEKLQNIQNFCRQNNSSLFENTFSLDLMKFLHKPPALPKNIKKKDDNDNKSEK